MQENGSRPSFGLASQLSQRGRMTAAHQHDDIEFNFAPTPMTYRIDGRTVEIPANQLAAFWAARPHQLIDDAPDDWVRWLTIPLGVFLSWASPDGLIAEVLKGRVVLLNDDSLSAPALSRMTLWDADLRSGSSWSEGIVRLEIEAYLRRLSFTALDSSDSQSEPASGATPSPLAGHMAAFIAARSTDPITVADVARAVHVHPGYAMSTFRRVVGTTIGSYLTQCRVAHAQRLLITTSLQTREIGMMVGFQSASQFYDRFGSACGTSPGAYRKRHARELS